MLKTVCKRDASASFFSWQGCFRSQQLDSSLGAVIDLRSKSLLAQPGDQRASGFPETNKEFERFGSFKVHDLDVLLKLSGYEGVIKSTYFSEWSTVMAWRPEVRYARIGATNEKAAKDMIDAAAILVRKL